MKKIVRNTVISAALAALYLPGVAAAAPDLSFTKQWTYTNTAVGQTSEIAAFDSATNSLWVAGIAGVDVLNATNGSLIQHIDTTSFGSINSVAIYNGVAAFAIEATTKTNPGLIQFYDTTTRSLTSGINSVTVGALPDMLTFTPDGSKLLVANEATPNTYGAKTSANNVYPVTFGAAALDPVGSVSIIDMSTRTVSATAGFGGVATSGSNLRSSNTGMDYEPEYIAVNAAGTKAFVSLQEANGMGVLDLTTNTFTNVIGLGAKDFSLAGNQIDPLDNSAIAFISPNVKGLYMPDGMATYQSGGNTYVVMANEGDFREDDGDRSAAGSTGLGAAAPLNRLRVVNTESAAGNLYAAGARSFSIRDENGNIVYDSGDILDKEAFARGIYDDGRSRDKGVEPEGVSLMDIAGHTYAFVGLERTTTGAVAVFDITDPANASFVDMIVTTGDLAPEGMAAYTFGGNYYLAIANETSKTTTLYAMAPVPEPETYAMMLGGLGLLGFMARRRRKQAA